MNRWAASISSRWGKGICPLGPDEGGQGQDRDPKAPPLGDCESPVHVGVRKSALCI